MTDDRIWLVILTNHAGQDDRHYVTARNGAAAYHEALRRSRWDEAAVASAVASSGRAAPGATS